MFYAINDRFGLTLDDVRRAVPNVSLPESFAGGEFGVIAYEPADPPQYDSTEFNLVEVAPVDGKQQWQLVEVSQAEKDARKRALIPPVVTMRQARLALLQLDKLAEVEALIAQLGTAAQIEWEYAQTIERDHPLVAQFAAHEVDAFFQLAATL